MGIAIVKPKFLILEINPAIRVFMRQHFRALGQFHDDFMLTESPLEFLLMFRRFRPMNLLVISCNVPGALKVLQDVRFYDIYSPILLICNSEDEKNTGVAYNCIVIDQVHDGALVKILAEHINAIPSEQASTNDEGQS